MSSNRHPVDQLADVRAEIRRLQAQETELKSTVSMMMGSADSLGGDQYIASQKIMTRKGGLDEAKLSAELGDLAPFRKPDTTVITINVTPRVREEAA